MEATTAAFTLSLSTLFPLFSSLGLGGVIGTFFGYWFKNKLDENSENRRIVREGKEKQYKDLLSNLLAFFEGWENNSHKKQFMREVYTNAPVYASDDVIKLANKFLESHDSTNPKAGKNSDKLYAELVIAIRKELNKIQGQPDTKLSVTDIKIRKLNEQVGRGNI